MWRVKDGVELRLEFAKTLVGIKDDIRAPSWSMTLKQSSKYHTIHLVTALRFSLNQHRQTYVNALVVMHK